MVLGKKAKYKYTVTLKGLMCGHCEANISEVFRKVEDVVQVRASFVDGQVFVKINRSLSEEEVREIVEKEGYQFIGLTWVAEEE